MAEFDSGAFSAVDSFFGADDTTKNEATKPTTQGKTNSGRRLGVGAAKTPKPIAAIDTTSKLLQVGRNKRKNGGDDDDEVDVLPVEDDEEDLGRTGIATEAETSKQENMPQVVEDVQPKKKKKIGKKERQKLKEQNQEETGDKETKPLEAEPEIEKEQPIVRNQKRKRRKVRSRQKNIYKDNRKLEDRPDTLLPGGYEYKGRPMTTATRSKLEAKNLLPVHANQQQQSTNDSNAFRASWDTTDQELEDNGVPVLSSAKVLDKAAAGREPTHSNPRKNKGKKLKSKYKNIQ